MWTLTISQFVGVFNIFVGLMITLSILLMATGTIMWVVRLGTSPTYRDDAIKVMQWAIALLFTTTVLLFVAQFVQRHTATAVFIIGFFILAAAAWFIFTEFQSAAHHVEKKEE
jgi:hypothetical protein